MSNCKMFPLVSALLILGLTACATEDTKDTQPIASQTESVGLAADTYAQLVTFADQPGMISQQISVLMATVSDIDYTTRHATLVAQNGNQKAIQFGAEAVNFDQVKQGDVLRAESVEEFMIYLTDEEPPIDLEAAFLASASEGGKPLIVMADVTETQATVLAIDAHAYTAKLSFIGGEVSTIAARADVTLSAEQMGKTVVFLKLAAIILTAGSPAEVVE